ncbi:uncharacterized protein NKAPD1 isoform X2 [Xyrichtys novacula]|nr:uncharacterized protein NKAPD1 isoform X2 [Xyrichtys novacula]
MWKMRGMEIQMSHHKHLSDTERARGRMHCDRDQRRDIGGSGEGASEHDDRDARYWTRKLYEFEAKDPERWGHSGFKELYPEEFDSDCEKNNAKKKVGRHKMKRSKADTSLSKRSKKSSRKKKKKKKTEDEGKRKKAESSSSSDDSSDEKDKLRRKKNKSRNKDKKTAKKRGRDEDSSSGEGNDKEESERRTHSRKKRKQSSHKDSDSGPYSKKKRKNWKAAGEKSSTDSSAD